MTPTRFGIGLLLAGTTLAAACGGSDDATDDDAPVATETTVAVDDADDATTEPPATEAPATDPPATEPPATDAEVEEPPETTAPPTTAPPLVPSLEPITVVPTVADVGDQPTLEWSSVDGAAEYRVVVRDGDGAAYWAWSGPETSVVLGGGSSPEGAGARVPDGGEWSVIARDADAATIATSGWTPFISP